MGGLNVMGEQLYAWREMHALSTAEEQKQGLRLDVSAASSEWIMMEGNYTTAPIGLCLLGTGARSPDNFNSAVQGVAILIARW